MDSNEALRRLMALKAQCDMAAQAARGMIVCGTLEKDSEALGIAISEIQTKVDVDDEG